MAITFPFNPIVGQTFTSGNSTWTWNGSAWVGGVGSGGNASTLDSLDSTQFLRSDTNDTMTGALTINNSLTNTAGLTVADNNGGYVRFVPELGIGGYNPISVAGDVGIIFSTDGANPANDANGLVIAPWDDQASGIKIMENGNVGIGISNPSATLEVLGNAIIRNSTGNGTVNIVSSQNLSNAGNKIAFFGASRFETDEEMAFIKPLLVANAGGAGNVQLGHLTFGTSGSERLRITSVGNVGIGTTNPSYKLDVFNSLTDAGSQIRVKNTYTSTNAHATVNIDGYGSSTLKLWRNGVEEWKLERLVNTDDLQLNAYGGAVAGGAGAGVVQHWDYDTGNIGINNTTPQYKLDVRGIVNNFAASFGTTLGTTQWTGIHFGYLETPNTLYRKSAIVFERTDNSGGGGNAAGKVHILNGPAIGSGSATLADARLTISELGNVGIGTLTPTFKLDVNGSFRATSITESSSIVYKENIRPIENSLAYIEKLVGVMYDRKDGSNINEAGLIAEDVESVLPNLVSKVNGMPEGIYYTKLTAYLIEAVKSLSKEVQDIKERLK